jgi:DNA polymerase
MSGNHRNARVFLEILQESGIEEVFLTPGKTVKKPAAGEGNQVWSRLREKVLGCMRCRELVANRHSVVFGSGNPQAKLVFVGEAPGAEEDRQGLPFVGPAGQLLTKMIESIGLRRDEVFIANVLKCRPPGNRSPLPQEIKNCEPYLTRQLELIRPRIICALGTFAAQTLLKTATPISALRGKTQNYQGIPVICTFHPAYLLRNPSEKRKAWEDLKRLKKLLGP